MKARISQTGNFNHLFDFLKTMKREEYLKILNRYGQRGVDLLSSSTPVDKGTTAGSWSYEIEKSRGKTRLVFSNSHINKGVNIAIILQYGHGTRNGGWVEGRDYINPAMDKAFHDMVEDLWKEIVNA